MASPGSPSRQNPKPGKKDVLVYRVEVPGIVPLLKQLSKLPKEANAEIRDAAGRIAKTEVERIKQAAASQGPQAVAAATSIRARRDRVPVIIAGGTKKVRAGGRRIPAQDIFFGAEFGGKARPTTQQFDHHMGTIGYFFYPTLREDSDDMMTEWLTVVDKIQDTWSGRDVG